jgi:hypothetical protein
MFRKVFQVTDSSFWITQEIGLTGVTFHFWPQKKTPSGSCQTNFGSSKSFLQLSIKLNLEHVISFMSRKSSCGYATHFFKLFWNLIFLDWFHFLLMNFNNLKNCLNPLFVSSSAFEVLCKSRHLECICQIKTFFFCVF